MQSKPAAADPMAGPVNEWLLLPGWGFAPSLFDELRAALPPALSVHAVACRDAAGALAARIDAVRTGDAAPFGICAWSLGATIALDHAAAFPGAVAAMVVTGATPRFVVDGDWATAMPADAFEAFAAVAAMSMPAAQARLASLCAAGPADAAPVLRRLRRSFDRPAADEPPGAWRSALLQGLDCLRSTDLRGRLVALHAPVAVVHGELDALVPAEAARALCGMLPAARWMPVPGGGHALPVVHPGLLADTIASLAGTASGPGPDALRSR
jgi:pimeloyl-[acyl-carrier protein] methyl ester esterase